MKNTIDFDTEQTVSSSTLDLESAYSQLNINPETAGLFDFIIQKKKPVFMVSQICWLIFKSQLSKFYPGWVFRPKMT